MCLSTLIDGLLGWGKETENASQFDFKPHQAFLPLFLPSFFDPHPEQPESRESRGNYALTWTSPRKHPCYISLFEAPILERAVRWSARWCSLNLSL